MAADWVKWQHVAASDWLTEGVRTDLIWAEGFGSDGWGRFGRSAGWFSAEPSSGTAATRRRQALTSSLASDHDDKRRNTTRRKRRSRFGADRRRRSTGRWSATEGGGGCFGNSSEKALRRRRDQIDDGKSFCGGRHSRWWARDALRGSRTARR